MADVCAALQEVLKTSLAHDGLVRGFRECVKCIVKCNAQLCVLAEDCNDANLTKLITALCTEHNVGMISCPTRKQLGEWAGLWKINKPALACSVVVVKGFGEETEGFQILQEYCSSHTWLRVYHAIQEIAVEHKKWSGDMIDYHVQLTEQEQFLHRILPLLVTVGHNHSAIATVIVDGDIVMASLKGVHGLVGELVEEFINAVIRGDQDRTADIIYKGYQEDIQNSVRKLGMWDGIELTRQTAKLKLEQMDEETDDECIDEGHSIKFRELMTAFQRRTMDVPTSIPFFKRFKCNFLEVCSKPMVYVKSDLKRDMDELRLGNFFNNFIIDDKFNTRVKDNWTGSRCLKEHPDQRVCKWIVEQSVPGEAYNILTFPPACPMCVLGTQDMAETAGIRMLYRCQQGPHCYKKYWLLMAKYYKSNFPKMACERHLDFIKYNTPL